jgi:hypothetical protein
MKSASQPLHVKPDLPEQAGLRAFLLLNSLRLLP